MGLFISRTFQEYNKSPINKLREVDTEQVDFFTFKGTQTYAKVADVYDGDTVDLVWYNYNNPEFIKMKCRLAGIDTPEIRTLNNKQKEASIKARFRLKELVSEDDGIVFVKFYKFDNFGKPLVKLYSETDRLSKSDDEDLVSINQKMLDEGFAQVYDGKKKLKWNFEE